MNQLVAAATVAAAQSTQSDSVHATQSSRGRIRRARAGQAACMPTLWANWRCRTLVPSSVQSSTSPCQFATASRRLSSLKTSCARPDQAASRQRIYTGQDTATGNLAATHQFNSIRRSPQNLLQKQAACVAAAEVGTPNSSLVMYRFSSARVRTRGPSTRLTL